MLTGDDLGKLKDEALWHLAPRTDLFVEIDPQQKERIVRALQRTGHSVGYLGDGINDAPALHAADVGISVEGAVDVARESADIILLNCDLDVLRSGVEDGRRTFANTLKYISITTSANFGNMVSMALATPLLPFLPLAAKQILLNNFLSDVPSIAISSDNVDPDRVSQPQRWNMKDIRRFMIVFGLDQLGLRPHHVRGAAPGLSRRRSHVSDILVCGLAAHRTRSRPCPADASTCSSQQAEPCTAVDHTRGRRRDPRNSVLGTPECGVWLCAAFAAADGHRPCHCPWLHRGDGRREGMVLSGANESGTDDCGRNALMPRPGAHPAWDETEDIKISIDGNQVPISADLKRQDASRGGRRRDWACPTRGGRRPVQECGRSAAQASDRG